MAKIEVKKKVVHGNSSVNAIDRQTFYVVLVDGKRVDSFLNEANAIRKAEKLGMGRPAGTKRLSSQ